MKFVAQVLALFALISAVDADNLRRKVVMQEDTVSMAGDVSMAGWNIIQNEDGVPSSSPSDAPSSMPSSSISPSDSPLATPVAMPSSTPSAAPSASRPPTNAASTFPFIAPSDIPSSSPSMGPSELASASPSTSQAPSVSLLPSIAPSISTAPSGSVSSRPSAAPSVTRFPVQGEVTIVLRDVPLEGITLGIAAALERDVEAFFSTYLFGITDIRATLADNDRRRLQMQRGALETFFEVTGSALVVEDISSLLEEAVVDNEAELIAILKDKEDPSIADFYSELVSVSTDPLTAAPSATPSMAPTVVDDDLGIGAIVGIAAGGVVFLLLAVAAFLFLSKRKPYSIPAGTTPSVGESQVSRPRQPQVDEASTTAGGDDQPINATDLGGDIHFSDIDEDTRIGASSLMSNTYDIDNMSYTYSLDAGHVDAGTLLGGQSIQSENTDLVSRKNMIKRQVIAPPGKLGIVIDTTLEGPVVHKVNENSPLDGLLFPGDIIVAIDKVDTRAMSASAITSLMVKTANNQRTLTVISED